MRIEEVVAYSGPSIYSSTPVVRLAVDFGRLEDWPTGRLGNVFVESLLDRLPGLRSEIHGDLASRMADGDGMPLARVAQQAAIELQRLADHAVGLSEIVPGEKPGIHHIVFDYGDPEVGYHAAGLAVLLISSLLPDDLRASLGMRGNVDFAGRLRAFREMARRRALDPTTAALVRLAVSRDIPWQRVAWHEPLVRLGQGRHQKLIGGALCGATDSVGLHVAGDRVATNQLLGDLGLPVPLQFVGDNLAPAMQFAEKLNFGVSVRPNCGAEPDGVAVDPGDDAAFRAAFEEARQGGATVVVEQRIAGAVHRLLVVAGEMVAAARCRPGHVVGDGGRTIAQLVQRLNEDPNRGDRLSDGLVRVPLDDAFDRALGAVGLTRDSVPEKGRLVALSNAARISAGGTSVDMTDVVHPDNRRLAETSAAALGLDIAEVEFVSTDVEKSHQKGVGALMTVNPSPDLRTYWVAEGTPPDVTRQVFERIYPAGSDSRVPIAAVTGTNGKTTTVRMVARILALGGRCIGMGSTDGVYIDDRKSVHGDFGSSTGAQVVLRDPRVEVAVLESARGGIVHHGAGFDRCNVGAVLNVTRDHLGNDGIDTFEQLARLKRLIVELARDTAVLNADDPLCRDMAQHTPARHVCWVAMDSANPVVTEHVGKGGRAAMVEAGDDGPTIVIAGDDGKMAVTSSARIPATLNGLAEHNLQNALFAAAIAYGMGAPIDHIRRGLESFDNSYEQSPARTNIYDGHPFKVIFDYGHNPAAVATMCRMVRRIPVEGRRIVIFGQPGDREQAQVEEVAALVAGEFDHFVCRSNVLLRGRDPEDIPKMSCAALRANGVRDEQMTVILDEAEAIEGALRMARPGDLVMVFTAAKDNLWPIITDFRPDFEETSAADGGAGA